MRGQLVLTALALSGLLIYGGIGLVRLLAFDRIRGGELVLAPAAGFALMVTLGSWSAWWGMSAGVTLVVVLGSATVLNVLALRSGRGRAPAFTASVAGALLALLVLAVGLTPLWTLDRPATVIGLNGDQVFYTNLASYLARHGLPVPLPGPLEPAALQLWYLNYGFPLGFGYVHAMLDRLTRFAPYETFSVVTALFLALNLLSYPFLAERVFGLGWRGAVAAGLLVSVSPTLMWLHYNNYAMHVLAVSLVPAAFGIAILALGDRSRRGLFLAGLLLSAIFVSYPFAAAPFLLAPLGVYALLLAWRGPAPASVLRRAVLLGLLMAAVNLAGLAHVVKVLRPMLDYILVKEFGDVLSHVAWAQLFGLVHHALVTPSTWVVGRARDPGEPCLRPQGGGPLRG